MKLKKIKIEAELRHSKVQYNIGNMYRCRYGLPQGYVKAYMWYDIAAANGYGRASRDRDEIAEQMTPEQISEAQRLAREWMEKHQKG